MKIVAPNTFSRWNLAFLGLFASKVSNGLAVISNVGHSVWSSESDFPDHPLMAVGHLAGMLATKILMQSKAKFQ